MTTNLSHEARLVPHIVAYELRKATAFRLGFVFRELLRGVPRPVVMALVYLAMFQSSGATSFNGYSFHDLVGYLVWSTALSRCLTDERTLDLAEQIFDGYITKYLVMPVNFFTLIWGRFVQFTLLQLASAVALYATGALIVPQLWPQPTSGLALLQALVLLLLGAGCYLLTHFILNCLAFWLDVVWSLLNMFRFVSSFIAGSIIPVALMPEAVQQTFRWLFPYWTVFAPAELLLGRSGTPEFVQGVLALGIWLLALQILAVVVFRRGVRRYAGVGA